jgi:hypothetical protein
MKKSLLVAVIAGMMASCSVYISPPFTDVEKIQKLEKGMPSNKVSSVLGIPPYDIYYMDEKDGYVVTYNYRVKNKRLKIQTLNRDEFDRKTRNEDSQTAGTMWYDKNYQTLYCLIQEGALVSYLTTSGERKADEVLTQLNRIEFIEESNVVDLKEKRGDAQGVEKSKDKFLFFKRNNGDVEINTDVEYKK